MGTWRWRNDDGSETSATWKAAENTPANIIAQSETIRLRYLLQNTELPGNPNIFAVTERLQYALSESGPWVDIDVTAGTNAFVMAINSPNVSQDFPTTQQITSEFGYTYVPGKVMVSSNTATLPDLQPATATELEWVIKTTANTLSGTTYYFRDFHTDPSVTTNYGTFPYVTTAAVLPVKLSGFVVNREGKKNRVEWTTASELNNDRFEVLRSSDGRKYLKEKPL